MINSSQTTLARLLAKENIEVQHGNFRTAFFDVEKRILGLPLWKDRGKDVYDLLTGHEVGHALFTPPEGWHDSTSEIPGIPRSYVNVVEDVRIEKLVQRQYPGLVSSFKRGYAVLYNEDFFQVAGVDLSSRNVVDRINLKAKCRDLVEVEYSAKEQPIVDQVMAVETWEDVIEACKALYAFSDLVYSLFLKYSKEIGSDATMVHAAGGNTSIKLDDTMWVKASGKWLMNAQKEEFVNKKSRTIFACPATTWASIFVSSSMSLFNANEA